jgi:hypothetical protein
LIFLTFLSLKKLWWDVKSISAYLILFFLGLSGAPRPWILKILIWRSKIEAAYISIWYFFWLQIARWFQKYKNVVAWRSTLNLTGQNDQKFAKLENFIYFDLIWPPVVEIDLQTTKFLHFWNQRAICNRKKYHIGK